MEIAFHSNKCALKDTLRILKRAKNPCWKRRKQLLSYSESLICTNNTILSLHEEISLEDQKEFLRLLDQFNDAASTHVKEDSVCFICMKNCLEETDGSPTVEEVSEEEVAAHHVPEEQRRRGADIKNVSQKMDKLNTAANFLESLVTLQNEGINQSSYDTAFSTRYSQNNLVELEEILQRKRRTLLMKRWLGTLFVFLCFLSLLLIKPLFPSM
ncbi:hypothetical protein NECID01_1877 [Nematocida sp. AWRm77]|nr:hypothetical protein NECID01_1877 [Nematocida sp. AWRm77]